jgi:hypothetical protein
VEGGVTSEGSKVRGIRHMNMAKIKTVVPEIREVG